MGTDTAAASSSPSPLAIKKPLPWTNPETLHLIQAYQDKWYSLKRGHLKATHWEEVAVTVALRCGYDHSDPSAKSGTQCRHKIEKLRKRYRIEKQRAPISSSWQFFDLMDCLLRGPMPISARPLVENFAHDEDADEEDESFVVKSRSIDYILGRSDGLTAANEDEDEVLEMRLAEEIRGFAGRLERMEKRKINMMRECERLRVEMENKRMQMIVDSQRKIVDIIATTFGDNKRVKIQHQI